MRRSSIGTSCSDTVRWLTGNSGTAPDSTRSPVNHLVVDGEGCADHGGDVLEPARGVADAVVAHLGRVPRGDLVDPERGRAHLAEMAAEAPDEDVGTTSRLRGRVGERLELRLLEV